MNQPLLPQWQISDNLIDYQDAVSFMQERVEEIYHEKSPELVWLLQHPPLYTGGSSAKMSDLLDKNRFPVYETSRGGQFTYHGPGQRIAYIMLDLKRRQKDIHRFIHALEQWIIDTLTMLGVQGERRQGRIGIWVPTPSGDKKIAALGIHLSHWISYHGIALNINPNLEHFRGIIPCGLKDYGVTSLQDLGLNVTMERVDQALKKAFQQNRFLTPF
jgi:lipoyl(octanoyl) transferase